MFTTFRLGRSVFFATLFLILLPFSARSLQAQQISGTITDAHGSAIPKASIEAKSAAPGAVRQATSDAVGHFSIAGLAAGRYTLTVTASGFTQTSEDVSASTGAQD